MKENSNKVLSKYPEVVRHSKAGKSLRDVSASSKITINTVRKVKKAITYSLVKKSF